MTWPFMALAEVETLPSVTIAGGYLANIDSAWRASQDAGAPFYLMCALLEKEGWPWHISGKIGGHNIYGHDVGGVFRVEPPGYKEVTEENFATFYQRVVINGERSNGVGPMQITHRSFFPQMKEQGLRAWVPYDNMLFGGRLFMNYYRIYNGDIRQAGIRYNGASAYGDRLLVVADKWKARLGG
jgi:hypothetical protein